MSVRAKFKCDSIEMSLSGKEKLFTIKLTPVYSSDPNSENAKFYKWTPNGHVHLSVVSEATAQTFELGKEYYLDFTPATAVA